MRTNKLNTLFFSMLVLSHFIFSNATYADDIDLTNSVLTPSDQGNILGNPNSPVAIVEYGDYQCPYCVQIYLQIEPRLEANYVNKGKAKLIYRNLQFLGDESIAAAAAAECAKDQGKFWKYHDALYAAKANDFHHGGGENDGLFKRSLFLRLARQINLNLNTFTACIDSNKYENQIKAQTDEAGSIGIYKTPTVYINGTELTDPTSFATYQKMIGK